MLVTELVDDAGLELLLKPGVKQGKWTPPPLAALGVGEPTRDWQHDWVDPQTGRMLAPEERNWDQHSASYVGARDWQDYTSTAAGVSSDSDNSGEKQDIEGGVTVRQKKAATTTEAEGAEQEAQRLPRSAASGRIVIVHISGGASCTPSQSSQRLFGQLAAVHTNNDVSFAATQLKHCPSLLGRYGVVVTPTVLVFDGAVLLDEFSGSQMLEPALQRRHGGQVLSERGVLAPFLEDSLTPYYDDVPKTLARELFESALSRAAGGTDAVPRLVMGELFGTLMRRIDKEGRLSLASSKWPK